MNSSSSTTNHKLNIYLLKTSDHQQPTPSSSKTKTNVNDRYIEYFKSQANFDQSNTNLHQINLLKFEFINSDNLSLKLADLFISNKYESYLANNYKSLILTSRQTIESIENSLRHFLQNLQNLQNLDLTSVDSKSTEIDHDINKHEYKLIVYCVGDSTENRFRNLIQVLKLINPDIDKHLLIRTPSKLNNNESNKGEHKQNALELSKLVINDFESIQLGNKGPGFKYALYPCSSIRKDDLSNELKNSNVSYDELNVYKTVHSEQGLNELELKLRTDLADDSSRNCLVFFSPSGCDAVFSFPSLNNLILSNLDRFKFVSVGPSTSSKLKQFISQELFIQLDEPSPKSLFEKLSN